MDEIELPNWARRHNYFWHSNPKSKTRSKTLFDKCVIRPKLSDAWHIVKSELASSDQIDEAWKTIRKLDGKFNEANNANMECGKLAQTAVDMAIFGDADLNEAKEWAYMQFHERYVHRSWDDGTDELKCDQYLDEIEPVVENAYHGLMEALAEDPNQVNERELIGYIGSNKLPYKTLPDYAYRGDLKTKWSKRSKTTKSGWAQNSLPKNLTGVWEQANVSQVAGFRALNGGMPCWLLYVNKSDYRLFHQYNCDEMKPDYLDEVIREIERQNNVTEKFLQVAEDTSELMEMISPEWNELCWQEPPSYLEEAYEIWKR